MTTDIWILLIMNIATFALLLVLFIVHMTRSRGSRESAEEIRRELRSGRDEARSIGKELREEVSRNLKSTHDTIINTLNGMGTMQLSQLQSLDKRVDGLTESNRTALNGIRDTFDTRVKELRDGNQTKLAEIRTELTDGLKAANNVVTTTLEGLGKTQHGLLEQMTNQLKEHAASNQGSLERIRSTFDERVRELQAGNETKLEEMRRTVDEKLHNTLEKRLGDSFKLVTDQLESVHKGLGEMQSIATGVGDLKRVLTNVKARGTWAEVQLGAILEQTLTNRQFERNVAVKPLSGERVEFAIRLPGPKGESQAEIWLPIDSKFPKENYLRLQDATETGDSTAFQAAVEELNRTIRGAAKDIRDKYISPPNTTDFAIMFLATEGLHAEVLRQTDLVDELYTKYKIVVAGPTTLTAILSSLRMGFQTLAIEQRASEVWRVLGAVKTEFAKFGGVLDKLDKQLETARRTIEESSRRSRAMQKKLCSVDELPETEAVEILSLAGSEFEDLDPEIDSEPPAEVELNGQFELNE